MSKVPFNCFSALPLSITVFLFSVLRSMLLCLYTLSSGSLIAFNITSALMIHSSTPLQNSPSPFIPISPTLSSPWTAYHCLNMAKTELLVFLPNTSFLLYLCQQNLSPPCLGGLSFISDTSFFFTSYMQSVAKWCSLFVYKIVKTQPFPSVSLAKSLVCILVTRNYCNLHHHPHPQPHHHSSRGEHGTLQRTLNRSVLQRVYNLRLNREAAVELHVWVKGKTIVLSQ